MSGVFLLNRNIDVSYLDDLLLKNEQLQVVDDSVYQNIPQEHLALWCHNKGIYGLPTTELVDWLKSHIVKDKTIEIGAGNGALGRTLGIPITDSCMMNDPLIASLYALQGQPITSYPDDIIEMDAVSAVKHFKPSVVIGNWVTHKYREDEHWRGGNVFGIDEDFILDNVNKYIVIGNSTVHMNKRILDRDHTKVSFSWVRSRSMNSYANIIYIWDKNCEY